MINRFLSYTKIVESGCIIWTGSIRRNGYGRFRYNGKIGTAHRWIYQYHHGEISKKLYIDHICRVKSCVNINHLRAVTPKQNAIENNVGPIAINAVKTKCVNGHEYTKDNLYTTPNGYRACKECRKNNMRRYRKQDPEYFKCISKNYWDKNKERLNEKRRIVK
jgi:hypothetical protein